MLIEFHWTGKHPGMSQKLQHKREDVMEIDNGCWRDCGLFAVSIPVQLKCEGIRLNE